MEGNGNPQINQCQSGCKFSIEHTCELIQHEKRIQVFQFTPESQQTQQSKSTNNSTPRWKKSQENKDPWIKIAKKNKHILIKKNIKNKPSNAPPNNSTLTLTLRLGQDLLDHQPWLIKTRGMIWSRHDFPHETRNSAWLVLIQ